MKHWSFPLIVILSLFSLSVTNLQSAVDAEKPILDADLDVKKMLSRIEQLEQRVRELEQKSAPLQFPVTQMPAAPRILMTQPGTQKMIPKVPQQPVHPLNWKRQQINGIDFYIVPLSQSDRTTVR